MAANFESPIFRPIFQCRQLYAKAFFVVNDNFWHQTGGNFDCELDERRLLHLLLQPIARTNISSYSLQGTNTQFK